MDTHTPNHITPQPNHLTITTANLLEAFADFLDIDVAAGDAAADTV
ncbi:MAG: integrase, partial [Moorea sp. SIO3G5]|nr:integrase [Moorena sp. SIO3G5]